MKNTSNKVSQNKEYQKLKSNTERGSFLYKVYGLINPIDNTLFYIGCTKELIYFRVYNHFLEAKNTSKKKILHELLDVDLFPIVKVFYEFEDRELAYHTERYLTNFLSNYDFSINLTNILNTNKIKL